MTLALVLATRLVAARVVPGVLTWLLQGALALMLLWVWWLVPLRHERQAYGTSKLGGPKS